MVQRLPLSRSTRVLVATALLTTLAACSDPVEPDPEPREFELDLGPGQSAVLEADEGVLRIRIPASEAAAEYRVAVGSAARTEGATTMRLRVLAGDDAREPTASRLPAVHLARDDGARRLRGDRARGELSGSAELRLRENARSELRRRNARPASSGSDGALRPERTVQTALRPTGVPEQGDTLRFHYPVSEDLTVTCDTTESTFVTGLVRAVGERTVLVEDTATRALLSPGDYGGLTGEFDEIVFATDSAYFGGPADIDGNERVIVLLTPEVNKLSPQGSNTRIGGFFIPTDLADAGDAAGDGTDAGGVCEASNEAEILYLMAPDPEGAFGRSADRATALRNARSVTSHEFQHLLNAEQRLIFGDGGFDDLEEVWLSEGMSHVAEEVVGLKRVDHAVRQNLGLSQILDSESQTAAFNTFHLSNFSRLQEFLEDSEGTRALAQSDPGGERTLEMRGFGWIFLRWLGDRFGPAGSGIVDGSMEEQFFRELASGGPSHLTGIENVERATGRSWEELTGRFAIMPAVDDDVAVDDPGMELATWNLRDAFRELHLNDGTAGEFPVEYPLEVRDAGFSSADYVFDVRGSTARHFTFTSQGASPELLLELTDSSGDPLPGSAAAQITVVQGG